MHFCKLNLHRTLDNQNVYGSVFGKGKKGYRVNIRFFSFQYYGLDFSFPAISPRGNLTVSTFTYTFPERMS
jgi:hypothetical protein